MVVSVSHYCLSEVNYVTICRGRSLFSRKCTSEMRTEVKPVQSPFQCIE